jgi:hypothetical protein
MTRFLAGLFVVAALVVGPAASVAAAPDRVPVVHIVAGQVELEADGTVSVPLRVRCSPPLYAFELDVSVVQGSTFGSLTQIGTPFPACTGRWERITVSVAAETGTFSPGPATVSVFIGIYDPDADSDLSAEDSASVTL